MKEVLQLFGLSEMMVKKPLAALVLALIISDIGGWYLYAGAQKAHNEDESALLKCEAEKLEISRAAMNAHIQTIKELLALRDLSGQKLKEMEAVKGEVKKLKK